jgi:hypothetical protein
MLTGVSIFCLASFPLGSRTFTSDIVLRSTTLPPSFGISSVVQATTRAWGYAVYSRSRLSFHLTPRCLASNSLL